MASEPEPNSSPAAIKQLKSYQFIGILPWKQNKYYFNFTCDLNKASIPNAPLHRTKYKTKSLPLNYS